jgi:hypothetical protein
MLGKLRIFAGVWAGVWAVLLLSSLAIAQKNRGDSSDPTFTFTPAHGNKIANGHFSPGGAFTFIDEFDGMVYSIEIDKIERIVLTAEKIPDESKCGNSSKAVITFRDGSRQHGCLAPAPLAFVGVTAVPSVAGMVGKFVREKH